LVKRYHDDTITRHSNDLKTICIYTDGSSINRKVGAATYIQEITKKRNLGKDSDYNVFAGELTAIDLGIYIIKEANHRYENCILYIDSQVAIQSIMKPFRQSGQQIIQGIHDQIDILNTSITMIWIPGHMDIPGNEAADEAAKQVVQTEHEGNNANTNPTPTMKSARNMVISWRCKEEWDQR